MKQQARLHRLEVRVGPPPPPQPPLSAEAMLEQLGCWIDQQTYNRGVFDEDPAFRPAWSHYHELWERVLWQRHGNAPLRALWQPREPADFEVARQRVLAVMIGVLQKLPSHEVLAEALAMMAAPAEEADQEPSAATLDHPDMA